MTTETTDVDISTLSDAQMMKAAYEVLKDKALFNDMVKAHSISPGELQGFHDTAYEAITDSIKVRLDESNSATVDAIFNAFVAITVNWKKKRAISQAFMQFANTPDKSNKSGWAASLIACLEQMIETLEACKADFDREGKLKEVEMLMARLGLDPIKSLMVLKERKKAAGAGTTTRTKKTPVTFAHYFLNEKGEAEIANLSAKGTIAKDVAGNPAQFFDWLKASKKLSRSTYRVDRMSERRMEGIKVLYKDEYLAHIKTLAVAESVEADA